MRINFFFIGLLGLALSINILSSAQAKPSDSQRLVGFSICGIRPGLRCSTVLLRLKQAGNSIVNCTDYHGVELGNYQLKIYPSHESHPVVSTIEVRGSNAPIEWDGSLLFRLGDTSPAVMGKLGSCPAVTFNAESGDYVAKKQAQRLSLTSVMGAETLIAAKLSQL